MKCGINGWMAVAVCLCMAGCGGVDHNLVPVEGTVTLDGKPLANKSLMFTPVGEGIGAGGNTDGSGKYTLVAIVTGGTKDEAGVPPGSYKVTVFEPLIPIEGSGDDPAMADFLMPGEEKSGIPTKYQDPAATPLTVEVPEAGGTIDLELTSG